MNLVTITESVKASSTEKKPETKHKLVPVRNGKRWKVSDAILVKLNAIIKKVKDLTGIDLSEEWDDTHRELSSVTSKAGADTISWHKTGRAVDVRSAKKWLIMKDKQDNGRMMFKIYLDLKKGLVLESDDPKDENLVPEADQKYVVVFKKGDGHDLFSNYLPYLNKKVVNVTAIFQDHGFTRIPAHPGWEANTIAGWNRREWWHYEKRDELTMYAAIREVYTAQKVKDSYKGLLTTLSGRNKYGPRLMREGWPHFVIDGYVAPYPATGEFRLWFPIGDGGNSTANHPWDAMTLSYALVKLGYLEKFRFLSKADTAIKIQKFQTATSITPKSRWMSVGGTTHTKFNYVMTNKSTKGSNDTTLYGDVGDGQENFPADIKKVIYSFNVCYDAGLCSAFMSSKLTMTDEFTTALETVIEDFQQHEVGMSNPDGVISKGGGSHTKLADLVDTAIP